MAVRVQIPDIWMAFQVWKVHHAHLDGQTNRTNYYRYLNDALPVFLGAQGTWELTEGAARRMGLLLGPHACTVIKAYEAKNLP